MVKCPHRELHILDRLKTISFTAAHTYIAHNYMAVPPPGRIVRKFSMLTMLTIKVFVSFELPALCGTKVVQYNNVLFKLLSLPR